MVTLRIKLLPQVDYFNVHVKLFTTRKLEHSEYICFTFTMFFSEWAYGIFGTQGWLLHVQCEKEMTRLQIGIHCYSNNLGNYIKTHGLISTKLPSDVEQKVFSLCAKLRLCPLCDISTINQPLFRGWGPPLRGGIVIWLARPFGPSYLDSMLSG